MLNSVVFDVCLYNLLCAFFGFSHAVYYYLSVCVLCVFACVCVGCFVVYCFCIVSALLYFRCVFDCFASLTYVCCLNCVCACALFVH